ncbi:hypothetical protein MKEN_00073500 [Mycena kentingensis (nom. inval.)]|nr:hypothetical protein MKEN_00073500 [Mycena kentingensis (nom. inval.)]
MSPPTATHSLSAPRKSLEKQTAVPPKAPSRMQSQPTTASKRPASSKPTLPTEQKKASHRSSKPIINWFQRKLAGGSSLVKPKRAENQQPLVQGHIPMRSTNRVVSAPLLTKQPSKSEAARRKTISLNEDDDGELYANDLASERSRDSMWSPTSAIEADEDASMRPIPPSAPPSPAPSSASYVSDPRTFRSLAASTKPTTLLSIDLNGNGMAHIAQAPAPIARLHVRSSSTTTAGTAAGGAAVSFSALAPSATNETAVRIFGTGAPNPPSSQTSQTSPHAVPPVQAPLHTTHHPRNNPRPSSPPLDNASVLTLASSAYAMPMRAGVNTPGWSSAPPSALGDSLSHFGGSMYADAESTSHYLLGDDDVDASVRALRPRSSRRGSWESEASRWSARVLQGGVGTPSVARDGRSLWTANSIREGALSVEDETDNKSEEGDSRSDVDIAPTTTEEPTEPSSKSDSQSTQMKSQQQGDPLRVPLPASTEDLVATPEERPQQSLT